MGFHDIPNAQVLKPTHPHSQHRLVDGSLFHSNVQPNGLNDVCNACLRQLNKCSQPKLSLANNMWLGEIPFQLAILTLPEQLLVALYFPAAYIFKVYPKNVRPPVDANVAEETIPITNEKLKGNVSTFSLPISSIAHMAAGNIVPRPSLLLAAVIGVTFVGVDRTALKFMRGTLRVRRQRVFEAILWLKANNRLYANVNISEENLRSLPEDGIPDEISLNVTLSDDINATTSQKVTTKRNESRSEIENSDEEDSDGDGEEPTGLAGSGIPEKSRDSDPVFPLQSHGVLDVGGANIPDSTLFSHAAENVVPSFYAQDYGVQKGHAFVNEYARVDENNERFDGGAADPNHLLGAFPALFPYGLGGFEVDRRDKVTYEEHVRWALQYADGRFRKHTRFAFQVFGVLLKRQTAFKLLKPRDFIKASEEEMSGRAISNATIRLLRRHITTVRARVQGTDESRVAIRAQIWGMTLKYNPPTLWATINLSDSNDPIAQVLAGQSIDMDNFVARTGMNATTRAQIIGADPFAAAEYFHLVIRLLLRELIGVVSSPRGSITRQEGIFGLVNGYIGTVEAQARGSLHLHVLFWVRDAPTSSAMQKALQSEEFRHKVKTFIRHNIRADVSDLLIRAKPDYANKARLAEDRCAAALQTHECTPFYCLKTIKGRLVCKRGYPWPTYSDDWVDAEGNWGPKRRYPFFNTWNPPISQVIRSNMDIKLLTNACETKDIAFYITLYIAKKQVQAANASAVLAKSHAFEKQPAERTGPDSGSNNKSSDIRKVNKRLLEQCANTLSRQYELSGPEVMSYLMGWGDRYISHTFVKIYWDLMVSALHRHYPLLKTTHTEKGKSFAPSATSEHTPVVMENGQFILQDQLGQTYHVSADTPPPPSEEQEDHDMKPRRGRPLKQRIPYMNDREGARVIRGDNQETALHLIGRWLPRDDDSNVENYAAQILLLLKPWRTLDDLKGACENFASAKNAFLASSGPDVLRTVENIQYYHDSSAQARRRRAPMEDTEDTEGAVPESESNLLEHMRTAYLGPESIEQAREEQVSAAERKYGEEGLAVAERAHIFATDAALGVAPTMPLAQRATDEEISIFKQWESKTLSST
ncbi:ATP-dependent DNA helicase [Mycena indigotica]|uniref:ATP-dependent DNA helicase n=1 Tax=Mycena indigotica TaxID=2126181 RepID=A0A8H6S868_9AGAR|nr:ATP-dependent DNA helicase [Mycena indigotica]KAF7294643.1 ATP-dependent DNA helicase [Mycena indigotica]